jgi:hypothetical protein
MFKLNFDKVFYAGMWIAGAAVVWFIVTLSWGMMNIGASKSCGDYTQLEYDNNEAPVRCTGGPYNGK